MNARLAYPRLLNQRVAPPQAQTPAEVVGWMGALQAQDYHQAVWALGARLAEPSLARVEQAIAAGEILRTWPMRGTIHWVLPQDAAWMVALSAERLIRRDQRRLQQLEIDVATLDRCQTLIYAALQGGQRLARPAMMALFEHNGIRTDGQRGYHILWHAALRGVICIGPNAGKQVTFALLDEWAGRAPTFTRDEALARLAERYFTSHGPATLADFAWWAGQTLTDARLGLEGAGPALVSEQIEGETYWYAGGAPGDSRGDYLLAGFDEYLLGYQDRSAVLDPRYSDKIAPGANGIFFPMIVHNGQIVGTWKREIKKTQVRLTLMPFKAFSTAGIRRVKAAAEKVGAFLGLETEVSV